MSDKLTLEDATNDQLIEELEMAHELGQLNTDQAQRLRDITNDWVWGEE